MSKTLEGNIIKKAHEKVSYTQEQYEQFLNCIPEHNKDAHHYFMTNFGYLKHPKHGKQLYVPYDYQIKLIDNFHNYRFNINMLGRQMGKALSGDTQVLTDTGMVEMKNLNVGDMVANRHGDFSRVLFKTDKQENHKCYELMFDTGEKIVADENHDWMLYNKETNHICVMPTKDFIHDYEKYAIPCSNKIDVIPERLLAYSLIEDSNISRKKRNILNTIIYKYAVFDYGYYRITHEDPQFLKDIQLIVSSMGIKCVMDGDSIRFSIRKYEGEDTHNEYIGISSIVETPSVPVYCIEVDNSENTFLIGSSLITTHNCVVAETKIKVKNKITNEAIEISIGDFHNMIKGNL